MKFEWAQNAGGVD